MHRAHVYTNTLKLTFPSCFSLGGLIGICLWWKFPGPPATGTLTGCVFLHPSSCLPPSSLLLSATSYNDSQHPGLLPCFRPKSVQRGVMSDDLLLLFSILFLWHLPQCVIPWWYKPISNNANQRFLNISTNGKKRTSILFKIIKSYCCWLSW